MPLHPEGDAVYVVDPAVPVLGVTVTVPPFGATPTLVPVTPFTKGNHPDTPKELRPLTQYHLVTPVDIVVSKNGEDTFVKSGFAESDGVADCAVFQNIS